MIQAMRFFTPVRNGTPEPSQHILTVDVEDGPQSRATLGARAVENTLALLELFQESGARATFFVVGKLADRHPELARRITEAGHEVATHGYSHESLESMTVKRFKEELHRSVEILREQTQAPIHGHRGADFSVSNRRLYFLEYLLQEGLMYDSSIFPSRYLGHGVSGAYPYPHLVRCASRQMLIEFPPAAGMGGGCFAVLPYWSSKLTMDSFERVAQPATWHFHSYETEERAVAPQLNAFLASLHLSPRLKFPSILPKLRRLLSDFRFTTMGEVCKDMALEQLPVALDLAVLPIRYGNISVTVSREQ